MSEIATVRHVAKPNLFEVAQTQLDKAAAKLGLDSTIHALLREPMLELQVSFTVQMDDGASRMFRGFRVQYNDARGPNKGGIRFHPEETIDTVRGLAAFMTWKTAVVDIPYGGGKGGVICNPKTMSVSELERLSRAYIESICHIIGPDKDIPAPDVYTNPQIMGWMMDEYSKLVGRYSPASFTGKPLSVGGSLGRNDATARGGAYTVREAARHIGINLESASCAIQGFGNAGQYAAKLFSELLGCRIVAVSDTKGGIYIEEGLNPDEMIAHKLSTGSVVDFPGTRPISNDDLLELPVDILIPAALEEVITEENAGNIKAHIIAELANGPTTPVADDILFERGIFVIPDFLCNAGGVTVSYFEWVQNLDNLYWTEEEVHDRLDKKMTKAFHDVLDVSLNDDASMRMAAYIIAIERVAAAMKARGWV